jgi:5-formyltetrahydrofolate cyclo-ligase
MNSGEVATGAIVRDAMLQGKHVYIPYTYKDPAPAPGQPASVMDMVSLHSLDDYAQLMPDRWGIPSPSPESVSRRKSCLQELLRKDMASGSRDRALDLIVVPGMAFDIHRGRLGHGKGFYDYFLKRYQEGHTANSTEEQESMPFLGGSDCP